MDIKTGDIVAGFLVERIEPLDELEARTYLMRHQKSGARLLFIENDDEDKAFSISFKTPPKDDTGVFHILEHSVLCGSERFPVKEPFVNLLKSSMQTFLNAMTFPDKTMYPVASTNEADLLNLMDVYMDAVLHPNIYRKRAVFEQEGWHYELPSADGELSYNGVVFNEMKGALSDPDSVLFDVLSGALFPDTAYRFESGGDPRAIPTLTYEDYLDEHARHYRLSNSYITLYGDLDARRALEFLDENYLSCEPDPDPALGAPNPLDVQSPVRALGVRKEMATAPENACAGLAYVIGPVSDRERTIAAGILADALLGSNESPLKKALLDADLAGDVYSYVDDQRLQPIFVVELKGSEDDVLGRFQETFEAAVRKLVEEGIDRELVEASIAHTEFLLRESDFGISKGVLHAMNALSGWLYDDDAAVESLRYEDAFASLREKIDERYFEGLLEELFLDNPHCASAEIVPVEAPEKTEEALELERAQASLTPEEAERIVEETRALKEIQAAPDSPEDLAKLPLLELSDIDEEKAEPAWRLLEDRPLPCLRHDVKTHGIGYLTMFFDLDGVAWEDLPYVSILSSVLGKLDTERHTAVEVDTLLQSTVGRMRFSASMFQADATRELKPRFVVEASFLEEKTGEAVELAKEIWSTSRLDDAERLKAILQQRRIAMEQHFANSGHAAAMSRVSSYENKAALAVEAMSGVDFYLFLKDLLEHFDERREETTARLEEVARRVFNERALLSYAGSEESFEEVWKAGGDFALSAFPDEGTFSVPEPTVKNEAFIVPCDVCFTAAGSWRTEEDDAYSGTWSVINRVLSFDYLWNEVRVKGGAYGAGFKSTRGGSMLFYSYRDPNLDATVANFDGTAAWLAAFDPSEEEMRGYVISTVAGIDAPVTPRALARRQASSYIGELPAGWRSGLRAQALHATPEKIREQAAAFERLGARRAVCAFGNRAIIESAHAGLDVKELY